jgi:hypothetical protein
MERFFEANVKAQSSKEIQISNIKVSGVVKSELNHSVAATFRLRYPEAFKIKISQAKACAYRKNCIIHWHLIESPRFLTLDILTFL